MKTKTAAPAKPHPIVAGEEMLKNLLFIIERRLIDCPESQTAKRRALLTMKGTASYLRKLEVETR